MSNNLYDIVETCLQDIEKGVDIETVLFRYPDMADELRPILETAAKAIQVHVPDPSADVMRRNRARLLQQAAQMREAKVQPSRRIWTVPLRRTMVTLFVVAALFVSSTNLVRAASTTLPGDNLYPVKRTWEDVLVLFTFNVQAREALEVEHENERLSELQELFTAGRSVRVDFSGRVTRLNGDLWLVAGIPVAVSAQTSLPTQTIAVGDAIHVVGTTQMDGAVVAQTVELLPAGRPLPEVGDDESFEKEHSGDSSQTSEDNSGKESEGEAPKVEKTQTPESDSGSSSNSEPKDKSFNGVVNSINGNILVIDGQIVNISSAKVKGKLKVGVTVKVEGYYDANGVFIVTKIEVKSSDSGSSSSGDNGSNDNENHDDDHKSDNNNNDNTNNGNDDD